MLDYFSLSRTSERRQFQVVHLGKGDDERVALRLHAELEHRPPSDDL